MEDNTPYNVQVSLDAQLSSLVSALNLHVKRAEELAVEVDRIQNELAALQEDATA